MLRDAVADETVTDAKPVNKASAGSGQVEAWTIAACTNVALHKHRGRRHRHVAADRPHDDHVEVSGRDLRHFERSNRSLRGQVAGSLGRLGDVPLPDPGTR